MFLLSTWRSEPLFHNNTILPCRWEGLDVGRSAGPQGNRAGTMRASICARRRVLREKNPSVRRISNSPCNYAAKML